MRIKLAFTTYIPTDVLQTLLKQPIREFYNFRLCPFFFLLQTSNCFFSHYLLKFYLSFKFSYFL